MADPRFFNKAKSIRLGDLADRTEAKLLDENLSDEMIVDVASLDTANENHVSFLDNRKYVEQLKKTNAKACFVLEELADIVPKNTISLIAKNPYKSYALAAQFFYPTITGQDKTLISERSCVDKTAIIGTGTVVDAGAVIEANVEIGEKCHIRSNAVIEQGVKIGNNCSIGANATLSHCLLSNNIVIYSGAQIGQAGFGFAIDVEQGFFTVPQLGRVIIEDDVEIGSGTTIDRGAGPDTVIGQGTRIDNLVQIGHNVQMGSYCVIVAQTGISGSTKLGNFVMTGGQSGFAGHLTVGDGARIGAQAGVMKNIPAQENYLGSPAIPIRQFMKQVAMMARMTKQKKKKGE